MKIRPEILEFAEQMEKTMSRHDPQKGDSWKRMSIKQITNLFHKEIIEFREAKPDYRHHEIIDIANIGMMLWHRMQKEVRR